MRNQLISFNQALQLTLGAITPLDSERVPLSRLTGRVVASDLYALVDSPSADVSLKDGYAVQSADIAAATPENPVRLRLIGAASAGGDFAGEVARETAVRILSGARIPSGAEAVLSEEFADDDGHWVTATNHSEPGRNILPRGTDVHSGQFLVSAGTVLRPAQVGLLAAAGHDEVPVIRQPSVAIIATGDEVVAPGERLREGELYASNLVTLSAWCTHYGLATTVNVVQDDAQAIENHLLEAISASDAIVTSGGAWKGERDLVVGLLDRLGWEKVYHRARMGPGKAAGFGLWQGKPVFCLPGGPPSNQMAFLQLALPGLLKLAGHRQPGLPEVIVKLAESVEGQQDWTQFVEGRFQREGNETVFHPFKMASRLESMATAEGFLAIPEGTARICKGTVVRVQLLTPDPPAAWSMSLGQTSRPPVISCVAKSGSGKTTFLEKLIPELKARGLRVGLLKHHAHATPFDLPGKDTYRLAQAGAEVVVGACPVQVAVFRQEDGTIDLDSVITRHLGEQDLVLTEGFKRGDYPKVEIHRAAHNSELLCDPDELLALVTDEPLAYQVPQFDLDDATGVAEFLLTWLRGSE